ncbi:MAG: hypothetical protein Q4C58_07985 [Eubacteriales bacterium]|nr:hypothetical protein [Eubacteriales bacterium]
MGYTMEQLFDDLRGNGKCVVAAELWYRKLLKATGNYTADKYYHMLTGFVAALEVAGIIDAVEEGSLRDCLMDIRFGEEGEK